MQSAKVCHLVASKQVGFTASRALSSGSILNWVVRKVNKFVKGSETPYQYHDYVREQMIKEGKYRDMRYATARTLYLRDKARDRIVKHNAKVRKLEDKVTKNGVFVLQGHSNKF